MAVSPFVVTRNIDQRCRGLAKDRQNVLQRLIAAWTGAALDVAVVDGEGQILAIHVRDQRREIVAFPLRVGRVAEEAECNRFGLERKRQQRTEHAQHHAFQDRASLLR